MVTVVGCTAGLIILYRPKMRLGENSIEDTSNKESKQRNFDKQNTQSQDNENSLMWAPPPLGVLAASAAAIRKSVVPPIAAEFDRIQHDIDDIINQ